MLLGDAPSQVFSLGAGSVRAEVAKLKQGERFIIRTSDAEVEVRGTSFRVAYAASDPRCGNGTTTRVSVDEGVVTVRSTGQEWTVAAHESWPRGCDATANPTSITTARPSSTPAVRSAPSNVKPTSSTSTEYRVEASSAPRSDLARQDDLFDEAMTAKRRGDTVSALGTLDRLLAKYPTSPLAEHAMIERVKILKTTDPARAATAARDYLARFPSGVARAEAEAVVRASTP